MLWSYGGAGRWRGSRRSWFWFVGAVSGVQVLCIAVDYCCVATAAAAVELLVQRFAAADVAFLVQAALAALHHVNKVGQRLLLVHRDIPEVATHRLCQLGLVESGPGLQLVVSLVASQRVHLKLEKVDLRHFHIMIRGLSSIVTGLPLPLVADALDEVLMEVADIEVSHALVDVQLELLLRDALLDPLTEGGVSSGAAAALSVLDQTAALAVKQRSRRSIVAVLLCTKPIHLVLV